MKKLKGKLEFYAKEREEFEQKKRELEEEMSKGRQNMERIRRGLRTNEEGNEEEKDGNSAIKRTKSIRMRPDTSDMKSFPIPSGPKISDWCYSNLIGNGSLDFGLSGSSGSGGSGPPQIKTQELYEEIRFLGRGSFGTVDLVKNREENKL
jgi:hypothetical protein